MQVSGSPAFDVGDACNASSTPRHKINNNIFFFFLIFQPIVKGKTKGTPLWGTHRLKVLKRYHLRL